MALNLTHFAFLPALRFSCDTLLSITSVSAFVLALALLIYELSLTAGYNKPIPTPAFFQRRIIRPGWHPSYTAPLPAYAFDHSQPLTSSSLSNHFSAPPHRRASSVGALDTLGYAQQPIFASAYPALHYAAPPAPLGLGLSLGPAITLSPSHERRLSERQPPSPIRPAFAFDDCSYLAAPGGPAPSPTASGFIFPPAPSSCSSAQPRRGSLAFPSLPSQLDPRGGSGPRHQPSFGNLMTPLLERGEDEAPHQHSQLARGTAADDIPGDQRLPHHSGEDVSIQVLKQLGVLPYPGIDLDGVEAIAKERKYKNRDEINVSKEGMGEIYEEKIKGFFREHLHEDEEIRYIKDGSGYFDVRDSTDARWVRIAMEPNDLIVLPAGIYHRFTLDEKNYIKAMRLFQDEPKWVPHDRSEATETNLYRRQYLETIVKV
ncbi:hypothetical protein JCM21900_000348 [Sporobolomyces salmonicolor]